MLTVDEALAQILAEARPLPPVEVPLDEALGRVLAHDVVAGFDLPPFPNSAVDGFAVRIDEIRAASPAAPVALPLIGEIRAGDAPLHFPAGAGSPSESGCMRIMTGAPIPDGATGVVMKEDVSVSPDGMILFHAGVSAGENIRSQGQDIRSGEIAVPAGHLIRPSEIAMLACVGQTSVRTFPRPQIAIFTTGDEVVTPVSPGTSLGPGQIFNSNGPMIRAMAAASGFGVAFSRHLPDDLDRTIEEFQQAAPQVHAIVSCGGVSVGEHDHVRTAVERIGEIRFWRVAVKPGKPVMFGRIGECLFFGLPGNPVSSLVSFELFVRPALLRMAGHERVSRPRVRSRLLAPLPHRPGREEYARVMTTRHGDEFVSVPDPGQASHMVSSLVASNSLAVIPSEAGSLPAGVRVDVLLMEAIEDEGRRTEDGG